MIDSKEDGAHRTKELFISHLQPPLSERELPGSLVGVDS